eukprot:3953734-Prymnesium_polylepis.4
MSEAPNGQCEHGNAREGTRTPDEICVTHSCLRVVCPLTQSVVPADRYRTGTGRSTAAGVPSHVRKSKCFIFQDEQRCLAMALGVIRSFVVTCVRLTVLVACTASHDSTGCTCRLASTTTVPLPPGFHASKNRTRAAADGRRAPCRCTSVVPRITCSRWRWGGWWVDTLRTHVLGRKRPWAQRAARRGARDHTSHAWRTYSPDAKRWSTRKSA